MKKIRYMVGRQVSRLVFSLSVIAAAVAQGVTVTPKATDEALINPGMGFMCYHMAGRMWAYGAPVPPGDTLDWFPGTSTVYFRLLWSELEPEEGQFRNLIGKPVILKLRDGTVFVGILEQWRRTVRKRLWTAYSFSVRRIEWEDYVDDTQ